jgi:SAM-dependent methyltransferase
MVHKAFDGRPVRHYGRPDLLAVLEAALAAADKAEGLLTPEDLAPLDQFNTRGAITTVELAQRAYVAASTRVLDLRGGIGRAARLLAATFGCQMAVLDRTEVYCAAGHMLTERCGLTELVHFRYGGAAASPYADAQFNLVWTQHSTMNIADITALYRGGLPHAPSEWAPDAPRDPGAGRRATPTSALARDAGLSNGESLVDRPRPSRW